MKKLYKYLVIIIISFIASSFILKALAPQKWEAVKSYASEIFLIEKEEKVINKTSLAVNNLQQTNKVFKNNAVQKVQKKELINTTSPTAVTIAATLSAAVTIDNAPTGASATDEIEYTSVVSNAGSTDATGVTFTNTIDASTTLVAGSITASPIGANDNYTCIGNVGITVNALNGILTNDISPDNTTISISATTGTGSNGGTFTIASNGSFTYINAPGYTGAETFTYTVVSTSGTTGTGVITINVSNTIWFIDVSYGAGGSNGTLAKPFTSINAFQAINNAANTNSGEAGDFIFVYAGTYNSSAITLLNNQKLIGQAATASLTSITGITVPSFSNTLPATGGSATSITNTTAIPITLGLGNDVEGINFTSSSGTTMLGINVGALKVRDVSLNNTAGQALQITAGGSLDVQFQSISAAGAAKGISVNSSTGKFEVLGTGTTAGSGGTINNITTRGAEFNSCTNILLKNMNFTNANTTAAASSATDYSTANGAITLNNVANVTLTKIAISGTTRERGITGKTISNFNLNGGSTLTDCGDEVNEGCLYLQELTGTCTITDATLTKGSENIARVFNSTGTLTLNIGTDITTTIFNDTQTQNINMATPGALSALRSYCFIYTTSGSSTATATLNVRNTSFLKAGTHGFKIISDGSGTVNANVKSCTFNNDNAPFAPNDQGGSIEMTAFNTANLNYNILNNSCRGKDIALINIVAQVSSFAQGRVNNNTVTHSGTTSAGEGIRFSAESNSNITTEVIGNNVSGMASGVGILATATGGTGKMNATITNNTINITNNLASHNIQVQAGNSSSLFSNTTCANVANNTTTRPDLVNGFNFRVRAVTTGTHKLYLQGPGTDASTLWVNNGNTPTGAVVAQGGTYGTQIFTSTNAGALATCAVVSNPTYSIIQPTNNSNELARNNIIEAKTIEDNSTLLTKPNVNIDDSFLLTQLRNNNSLQSNLSGETVTVNGAGSGFILPANKSTTIKFKVTVNAAPASCSISTQATISGSNFANVLSDDPSVVGAANPTNTTLTVAPTTAQNVSATSVCVGNNINLTATAPNSGTPIWYTASTGGTNIGTGSPLAVVVNANTSYYVSSTVGGCESTRTLAGAVTIATISSPSVSATSVCIGNSINLIATASNGGTPKWYTASIGGTGIGIGSPLPVVVNANTSYYVSNDIGSCESARTFAGSVTATANTLPITPITVTQNVSNNTFNNASCALIATVLPNGSGPAITGSVTAKVWIDGTQNTQFVKRHYEITPVTNVANATAKITLYFTDAEFIAFNTQVPIPALLLPISTDIPATMTARKANLRIEKRSGTGDANGTFSSYTGTITTFNPNVADINWNSTASRWEVSFDVTGFSGFWVKTQTGVLPLTLLEFTGTKTTNGNLLQWQTSSEINTKSFEIEKQEAVGNGQWATIASQLAVGNGANTYSYLDADKMSGTVLYRLKMIDVDGRFTYSNIIKLSSNPLSGGRGAIYPNPITTTATLEIGDRKLLNTQANIIDANGRIIKTFIIKNNFEIVDMSGFFSGMYLLKMANGEVQKIIKQ